MTELRVERLTLPAADLGPENPLPRFRGPDDDLRLGVDDSLTEDDRRYLGWRAAWRVLPHRMQDGYSRERRPRALDAVVLRNERLRAVFLPAFGGKLWSLVDLEEGRELLDANPVIQPANLALRDAWLSGGIEWNAGQPGHHYLTCAPVFASRVETEGLGPTLRLTEWDRVKGFAWQIDFALPPGARWLFARVRLVNPHPHEIAMYWWTNMGVPEREDVRVIVPAEAALCNPYWKALQVAPLPRAAGRDLTYSMQSPHAADFFSRIADGQRRWIAAVGGDGRAFVETSTDRLRGRKLFCWGMGQGGRRWQEYLSAPGRQYIEIQAGLARTQTECLPMPAGAEWAWTEAFGALRVDAARAHGDDWAGARACVEQTLERALPRAAVEAMDGRLAGASGAPASERLFAGSGWAALERRRRAAMGGPADWPPASSFPDDSLGEDQAPWLALLERGALPERDPVLEPGALMTQPDWRTPIERSVRRANGAHWLSWWHLGNLRLEERDVEGAREAWERSLDCHRTGWALRNLAVLAERAGDRDRAAALLTEAWEAGPPHPALAVELAHALQESGRHEEVVDLAHSLPEPAARHERVLIAWARAAVATGRLDGIERVLDHEFSGIREGEVTLSDLWLAYHTARVAREEGVPADDALRERVRRECPPPRRIDFRMAGA
ncbi:MAG TPA: DUF5107 domain-containing protein [Chthonomonadales bacterium]|nr:DUF5107 domain-containing protein [Chthonomonadales bacterium]